MDCEVWTTVIKLSSTIAVLVLYNYPIATKNLFDTEYWLAVLLQSTNTNLCSKGLSTYDQKVARRDQRHQSIEKDKITVNKKTKKQTNKEKRNSLILNTENYKTERTTTKYLKWNKVLRKGKSSIICNQHVNNIQNIVNRHNRFRELRYFWDEL